MKMRSAIWERTGLTARLVFAAALSTCLAFIVVTAFSVGLVSRHAKTEFDAMFHRHIETLSEAASGSALRNDQDVVALLTRQLQLPEVLTAGYRGITHIRTLEKKPPVMQAAPAWFVRLCSLPDRRVVVPVVLNGQPAGEVALTLSPVSVVDQGWDLLVQQIIILLAGASIVFLGVALALRAHLKPLATLVDRSRNFGRGDFSQRMPVVGSREFRATSIAFNAVADSVESMIDALARSERAFATLVEAAPVGVIRVDKDRNIVFANTAMREMAAMPAGNTTFDAWFSRVHPEDKKKLMVYWTQVLRNAAPENFIHRNLLPDGRVTWLQLRAAPLRDGDGNFADVVVIVNDISAERELRQRSERLSRLYATLSRVNSIIAQTRDDETLYAEVCHAIVQAGEFEHATITLVDWDRRKLKQALSFGAMPSTVEFLERDLDDPNLTSVGNLALLEGGRITANDFINDERVSPHVRAAAIASKARSATAVPIRRAGVMVGNIAIASSEKDFFTDEILDLIDEIGRDVSFALDNIHRAKQKQHAEDALARSEQHLSVTLRSIGDAVLVTDMQGRVTMLNPVAETLTGWNEAEARGRSVDEVFRIVDPDTKAVVMNPVMRLLDNGNAADMTSHAVLVARDGSERPVADSGALIRYDDARESSGVVLVFRDQSAEHRMLNALRESERLYSSLAENVPVGIYMVDLKGDIRYLNSYFSQMLGFSAQEFSIRRIGEIIHPEYLERLTAAWGEACKKTETTDLGTFSCVHRDGMQVWVHGLLTPIWSDKEQQVLFVGVMKDITAEREQLLKIDRLSQLYGTLTEVDSAIIHCVDKQQLYDQICTILATKGGFAYAAIACPDLSRRKMVFAANVFAQGEAPFALSELDMDDPESRSMSILTLRSGMPHTVHDVNNDVRYGKNVRAATKPLGMTSLSTIAFSSFGEVVAVLSVASREQKYFSEDVLALLDEVGRNVSFALENLLREQQRRQAEAALKHNEERLRMGLSATRMGMYEVDFINMKIKFDAICAQHHNLGNEPFECDLDAFVAQLPPDVRTMVNKGAEAYFSGARDDFSATAALPLADGSIRWLHTYGALVDGRTPQGMPIRSLGFTTDVTAAKAMEERDHLAATVFDHTSEAIIICNSRQEAVLVNQAFTRITGFSEKDALNNPINSLYRSDRHEQGFYDDILAAVERDGTWQGEMWSKRKNGEVYPALSAMSVVRDQNGEISYFVEQQTDISKQKEFESRISELAYRDALTELPNRTLLRDRVDQSIAIAQREHHTVALLFLDLDHFKNINDSLGHSVGDQLLREIARRLTDSIRDMDTVGRLGGDEFMIVLPAADADAAARVAHKLLEESIRPFNFGAHQLTVTPSIGIAMYPKDGENFDDLLKTADTAMYRAKEGGRNTYRFYAPEMNQAVFQRMVLESSLRGAIEKNEFVLYYQPKFELRHQTLVGVEALIRWHQPDVGMISPAQFIPVAEESGLIDAIGKWVLEEACRQARQWRDAGLPPLRVAVNISPRQFAARNIAELVAGTLASTGLAGDSLEMEITESLLAQDMEYTYKVMQSIKRLGVHVAIDDFGTGYSSLSYLKRFPIDRLKVDQSFVRDLVNDMDDRSIATAIVTLGHSLGIRVIAEGVETAQQLEILREIGCDEVQGYYLGRPVPAKEMTALLHQQAQTQSRLMRKSV